MANDHEPTDFVWEFARCNSHMTLTQSCDDPTTYHLTPPNQCDWIYTLSGGVDGMSWTVHGIKHDPFDGVRNMHIIYVWSQGAWMRTDVGMDG